jgi:WD40 repeat protein
VIGLHLCKAHGWLFTCADRVRCWDVHSGRCLRVYGASTFYCAASDCRSLYAAQYDGLILQFDLHGLGREGSAPAGGADGDAEGARGADGAAQAQAGAAAAAGGAASGGGGGGGSAGGGGGALGKEAGADELEEVRLAQRVLSGHESGVMGFALRADLLVSASIDSTAKAWSRASGECVRTFVGHTAQLRAVALWRETLLTGSYDQSVRQWSLESGAQLRAFRGHTDAIRAIVVGVDVHACFMWSASSDGSVRQWDLESGAQVQLLRAHDESVFALAHAEGVLYTGSSDCTAKRYDLSTGKCIMTFPPPRSADRDAGRPDRVPHVSL